MAVKKVPNFGAAVKDATRATLKAAVNTVNITAARARKFAQENIQKNFTVRNSFTVNSVRFTQCGKNVRNLNDVRSETGITERAGYMARQETGGTKRSASGANLIIATTAARGGSNANAVRRKYHYDSIKQNLVKFSDRSGSRKAAGVAQAYVAYKTKKFIRRNDAIFRVTNFRKSKSGVNFRLKEILNLKHKSTQTPKNEWLEPAATEAAKDMQGIFNSQMDKI